MPESPEPLWRGKTTGRSASWSVSFLACNDMLPVPPGTDVVVLQRQRRDQLKRFRTPQ